MWQTLFHLPYFNTPVYGYGVMLVIGFIAAMLLAQYLARRSGLNPEIFANAAIIALVFGVLGARLSHVMENIQQYTRPELSAGENFWNAINIREGGLTYYGGFLLATPACILYGLWKRVPIPLGMDIIAPCLMIGLAFGRIGCYLNGCCYGAATDVKWAVEFPYGSDAYVTQFSQNQLAMPVPRDLVRDNSNLGKYMDREKIPVVSEPLEKDSDILGALMMDGGTSLRNKEQIDKEMKMNVDGSGHPLTVDKQGHTLADLAAMQHANPVHPAEIYSSAAAFLIAAFLLAAFTLPHVPGRIFAGMCMIEGVFRYVLEMLRVEPAVIGRGTKHLTSLPPQSYSMVVAVLLVAGGIVLWFVFGRIAGTGRRRKLDFPGARTSAA
jgi:phosphatidylglycerol:prolipoprotein diacylglycerol transferase